ncbi:unnamed protein product [Soboliphyme baturini]|uniref:Uncharacterized protein n=1 Tax=Soboliphyme baturini TaxID=241478 RepID=A0A183IF49_9BILA|nr:unnamed protein product [Soboliphyme baturini]
MILLFEQSHHAGFSGFDHPADAYGADIPFQAAIVRRESSDCFISLVNDGCILLYPKHGLEQLLQLVLSLATLCIKGWFGTGEKLHVISQMIHNDLALWPTYFNASSVLRRAMAPLDHT